MFPAKEENVATPLSKIHASGESLIYRSGIKKKTCLGGIGRFRRQTRVFGLSHVHEYVYLLSRRLFFVWQSDLQFKRGIHIISICAPRGSKPMVLPTPTAFSSTGATGTQRNSPSPELCTHTHTHKNTIININKYYSLCTACGRIANSEHSLYWSVETTGHNDSTSPPIMPHDVLSVTNQKVG